VGVNGNPVRSNQIDHNGEALSDILAAGGVGATVRVTGDYTITVADYGKTVASVSATDVTFTVSNDLPQDFICAWAQEGLGLITFAAESGGELRQISDAFTSSGLPSAGSLRVSANEDGESAVVDLGGQLG